MSMRSLSVVCSVVLLAACGGGGGGGGSGPVAVAPPAQPPPQAPPPVQQPQPPPQPPPDPAPPPPAQPDPPPQPTGLDVSCGINICMASWDNPLRAYDNHGITRVYRSTTNSFATARQIAIADWLLYTDDTAQGGSTYYYWVRFEADDGTLGPVSQVASAMPVRNPADEIDRVSREIRSSSLAQELAAPIRLPSSVTEELNRVRQVVGDLTQPTSPPRLPTPAAGLTIGGQVRAVLDILTRCSGAEVFVARPFWASYSWLSSSLAARI